MAWERDGVGPAHPASALGSTALDDLSGTDEEGPKVWTHSFTQQPSQDATPG